MFLRSLTIRGFKSFADRTTLEFTPGTSVIVGPNGSGKSNIADAIAWVLGEQGPRALRGGQMADVIFAGSPSRPALGMAEVSMVIDNSAGLIPVPASEIEISRTIYRSGDSEYRLGGRPCRLLDIQELLSDTGIGRALHTLIGQGQLEEVLTARPEDRRQLIEEAAGIAKHKRRRERAERKLSGMEGDLLRLQDLVAELRRQLKPMKQQAELAARHDTLTKDAAGVARDLAAARLRELYRERDRRRPSWQEAEARQAQARSRLEELDREIGLLDADRTEAERVQREAEAAHQEALIAKSEAEERLRAAIRAESRARERLSSATNRSGRLFALEEEAERTGRALSEAGATLHTKEAELEQAEVAFRAAERARRDAEDDRRRIGEEAAARRAESESLQRALAGYEAEQERLAAGLLEVRSRRSQLETRVAELRAETERLDALETPLAQELSAAEHERSELVASLGSLEAEEKGVLARQEVIQARRRELSESPGTTFARRRGGAAIGVLVDLVEAPADLRMAVKAALGPFADAVVYETAEAALADVVAEGAGGITLATADGIEAAVPEPSGDRPILDAIRVDPRAERLVRHLLGSTFLVNNVAEAAARHRVRRDRSFVTREGVLVGPSFVRSTPAVDPRLERVRRDAASLERELSGIHRRLREYRQRVTELVGSEAGLREKLEDMDGVITEAADQMASAQGELASLRREEQMLAEREEAVSASAMAARDRLSVTPTPVFAQPSLPPMPEPPMHLRVEVEALRRERGRLEAGLARARQEIDALAAEDPIALRRDLAGAESERSEAESGLTEAEGRLGVVLDAYRSATQQARVAQGRDTEANRAWREAAARVERIREEHEEEDRARLDLERRVADAERVLREGHGAEPAKAVAALPQEVTVEVLQRRADLVARRLGLLGRVNLLATGELDALQDRHDFMVRELDDVRAARRDLQNVIRDVDRQMAELFDDAFRDVSREFSALFGELFPGGEGRLTLTDPQDLLRSGIEVEARPGRKRVKRLSLLSGGERSLAALAFLFSIFRARPSPFYLMDEVEAALDDVNLHRFLEVVKGFALRSQILIVTHQKRTMEMADVLYGVSMGAGGASAIISQRLAEIGAG